MAAYWVSVVIFTFALGLEWLLNLFSLPGNWVMVLTMAGFTGWFHSMAPPRPDAIGAWYYVLAAAIVALLGEVIELLASAAGVAKGGSKRGAFLAVIGAIIGSLIGAAVGLPIPVVGSLVGILLFSALGAMIGAYVGETWKGHGPGHSLAIGKAAFVGRLLGAAAKLICGCIIFVIGVAMTFLAA